MFIFVRHDDFDLKLDTLDTLIVQGEVVVTVSGRY